MLSVRRILNEKGQTAEFTGPFDPSGDNYLSPVGPCEPKKRGCLVRSDKRYSLIVLSGIYL